MTPSRVEGQAQCDPVLTVTICVNVTPKSVSREVVGK